MSSGKTVSLLTDLYRAAADASLWPDWLQSLARQHRADHTAIFSCGTNGDARLSAVFNISQEQTKAFQSYFAAKDEWLQGGESILRTGWVGIGQQLCPEQKLIRTEFYNDYLRKFGEHFQCGAIINKNSEIVTALTLLRSKPHGSFSSRNVHLIRQLLPHLQTAIELHCRVSTIVWRSSLLEKSLNQCACGIILVGGDGFIVAVNEAASKIISSNDGLRSNRNYIHAECISEGRILAALLKSAADVPRKVESRAGGTIMISRRRSSNALSVFVSPICSDIEDAIFPLARAAAIVFIIDPDQRVRPRSDILSGFFGLTPAELRISLLLCDGKSLGEISEQLSISSNTLKTHLSRIFAKTGTARQAQLMRFLLSLPPESIRRAA